MLMQTSLFGSSVPLDGPLRAVRGGILPQPHLAQPGVDCFFFEISARPDALHMQENEEGQPADACNIP